MWPSIVLSNVNQLGFKLHHKARLKMQLQISPLECFFRYSPSSDSLDTGCCWICWGEGEGLCAYRRWGWIENYHSPWEGLWELREPFSYVTEHGLPCSFGDNMSKTRCDTYLEEISQRGAKDNEICLAEKKKLRQSKGQCHWETLYSIREQLGGAYVCMRQEKSARKRRKKG